MVIFWSCIAQHCEEHAVYTATFSVNTLALYSTVQDVELVHENQCSPTPSGNTRWKGGGQVQRWASLLSTPCQLLTAVKTAWPSLAQPQSVRSGLRDAVPARTESAFFQHKHLDNPLHHFFCEWTHMAFSIASEKYQNSASCMLHLHLQLWSGVMYVQDKSCVTDHPEVLFQQFICKILSSTGPFLWQIGILRSTGCHRKRPMFSTNDSVDWFLIRMSIIMTGGWRLGKANT